MVKMSGGDVDVMAGTGFRHDGSEIEPLIKLTITRNDGGSEYVWIRPAEARAIGLDLIGAAHASLSDAFVRWYAKEHGVDGDSMIRTMRQITELALGTGR